MQTLKIGGGAVLLVATALLLGAAPAPIRSGGAGVAQCDAMATQSFGDGVRITAAKHVDGSPVRPGAGGFGAQPPLPPHCVVEGVIDERKGAGGKTYGVHFAIALPDRWSGRFLLQGGGGLNGSVGQPTGPVAADGNPALARGFAVISDDSGHTGAVFDSAFMADQRAALDFAETSVLTTARLGKAITQAYYGKPIAHSYMTGCSTGGREGMLAVERYPEQFDGVIVGAPAMRAGDSNLGIEYTQVLMNRIAPKGADGKPDVSQLFTPAVRKTLLDGILDQCDKLDGLADGMIENVAACHFEPNKLVCKPGQAGECISAPLADALDKAFAGPFDKAGYPLYAPVPFDTGIVSLPMGYLPSGAPGPLGPASTATSIDLDARIHDIRWDAAGRLTDTPYWTNLNTFLDRGGKLMMFHGASDFWFSPLATWDWYQRAMKTNGAAFADASRFYMVPGMLHCQGGNAFDQFDMLSKLVDWVEKGQAPEAVIAHRSAKADETRPLCPYPSHAEYTGGDPAKAASFQCREPAPAA